MFTYRYVLQSNSVPNTKWTLAIALRIERNGTSKNRNSTVNCLTTKISSVLKETQILYILPDYELQLKLKQLLTTGDTNPIVHKIQKAVQMNLVLSSHGDTTGKYENVDTVQRSLKLSNRYKEMASFKLCPPYRCA